MIEFVKSEASQPKTALRGSRIISVFRTRFDIELRETSEFDPNVSLRIDEADAAANFARAGLKALNCSTTVENFGVISLDARGNAIGFDVIAQGTLTSCLVHPREVFAVALAHHAAHIVIFHNHPSGDPTPSPEDLTLTERLTEAGQIMGVPIVDHIVLGDNGCRSISINGPKKDFGFAEENR